MCNINQVFYFGLVLTVEHTHTHSHLYKPPETTSLALSIQVHSHYIIYSISGSYRLVLYNSTRETVTSD